MHMETEVMQTRGDSAYTSVACGAGTQGGRVSGWAAARGWGGPDVGVGRLWLCLWREPPTLMYTARVLSCGTRVVAFSFRVGTIQFTFTFTVGNV